MKTEEKWNNKEGWDDLKGVYENVGYDIIGSKLARQYNIIYPQTFYSGGYSAGISSGTFSTRPGFGVGGTGTTTFSTGAPARGYYGPTHVTASYVPPPVVHTPTIYGGGFPFGVSFVVQSGGSPTPVTSDTITCLPTGTNKT